MYSKTEIGILVSGLIVEKEKEYTTGTENRKKVYIFENYEEFKNYFERYGIEARKDIIDLAIHRKTKKGYVVAFKGLCDHIITKTKNNLSNNIESNLDSIIGGFFPKSGHWFFSNFSEEMDEKNIPYHIRDNAWLTELILRKYKLYYFQTTDVINYLDNSEYFAHLRDEYEQKIVSWQIDWMLNGGENWIVDEKYGGDLYLFSSKCDYAFRKGISDTLLSIGINNNAIEEGIEKNANKWREIYMRLAFNNQYYQCIYNIDDDTKDNNYNFDKEHYEKWLKLRLYEYYNDHKDSVDKYGEVLPAMKMSQSEVKQLKSELRIKHDERMKKIDEYNNLRDDKIKKIFV